MRDLILEDEEGFKLLAELYWDQGNYPCHTCGSPIPYLSSSKLCWVCKEIRNYAHNR